MKEINFMRNENVKTKTLFLHFYFQLKKRVGKIIQSVKTINLIKEQKASLTADDLAALKIVLNAFVFDVLGLMNEGKQDHSEKMNGVVNLLIKLRKEARENKDWALSDQIRDELIALGIQLKDGREGTSFSIQ